MGVAPPAAVPADLGSPERTHVYLVGDLVVKCDIRFGSLAMVREANALAWLAGSGLPVPRLVANGTFADGRRWVALERLPGSVPSDAARMAHEISPGLASQLGATIARLHGVARPPGFGTWSDAAGAPRTLRDENWNRWQALARMGHDRDPPIVSKRELDEVVRLGELTLDALDDWTTPVLAHRDVQPRNVLVEGDRLTALLDFESGAGGDPAEDFNVLALEWDSAGHRAFCSAYRSAGGDLGQGAADRLTHYLLRWVLAIYAYLGRIAPSYLAPARVAVERISAGEAPLVP